MSADVLYSKIGILNKQTRLVNINHFYVCVRVCVSSRTNLQSQEIVSELVYSFLIPEVEKMRVRQRGLGDSSISTVFTHYYYYRILYQNETNAISKQNQTKNE